MSFDMRPSHSTHNVTVLAEQKPERKYAYFLRRSNLGAPNLCIITTTVIIITMFINCQEVQLFVNLLS